METIVAAYVASNRSRKKIYHSKEGNTVFLQDKEEFQLELFNPEQNHVLAKIYINNKPISSHGLVIKPGQRVWLERYIDSNAKFVFNTYTVDDNNVTKKAIENNGSIRIEFFRESLGYNHITFSQPYYTYYDGGVTGGPLIYGSFDNSTANLNISGHCGTGSVNIGDSAGNSFFSHTTGSGDNLKCFSSSYGPEPEIKLQGNVRSKQEIETGRIEEGKYSSQTFEYSNLNFEIYAFASIEYKLLPYSQQSKVLPKFKTLKVYCTNCGKGKKKDEWRFCPKCGARF